MSSCLCILFCQPPAPRCSVQSGTRSSLLTRASSSVHVERLQLRGKALKALLAARKLRSRKEALSALLTRRKFRPKRAVRPCGSLFQAASLLLSSKDTSGAAWRPLLQRALSQCFLAPFSLTVDDLFTLIHCFVRPSERSCWSSLFVGSTALVTKVAISARRRKQTECRWQARCCHVPRCLRNSFAGFLFIFCLFAPTPETSTSTKTTTCRGQL